MEDYVLMTLLATLLATPCVDESGQLTLLSGAGEGEVVSKEVGEEERGTVTGGLDLWHHCSITGPQAIIKA